MLNDKVNSFRSDAGTAITSFLNLSIQKPLLALIVGAIGLIIGAIISGIVMAIFFAGLDMGGGLANLDPSDLGRILAGGGIMILVMVIFIMVIWSFVLAWMLKVYHNYQMAYLRNGSSATIGEAFSNSFGKTWVQLALKYIILFTGTIIFYAIVMRLILGGMVQNAFSGGGGLGGFIVILFLLSIIQTSIFMKFITAPSHIILNGDTAINAMGKSWNNIELGSLWKYVLLYFGLYILFAIAFSIVAWLLGLLGVVGNILSFVVNLFIMGMGASFLAAASISLYYRKNEGEVGTPSRDGLEDILDA